MVAWNSQRPPSGDVLSAEVITDALVALEEMNGKWRRVDFERTVEIGKRRVTCRVVLEESDFPVAAEGGE